MAASTLPTIVTMYLAIAVVVGALLQAAARWAWSQL